MKKWTILSLLLDVTIFTTLTLAGVTPDRPAFWLLVLLLALSGAITAHRARLPFEEHYETIKGQALELVEAANAKFDAGTAALAAAQQIANKASDAQRM